MLEPESENHHHDSVPLPSTVPVSFEREVPNKGWAPKLGPKSPPKSFFLGFRPLHLEIGKIEKRKIKDFAILLLSRGRAPCAHPLGTY